MKKINKVEREVKKVANEPNESQNYIMTNMFKQNVKKLFGASKKKSWANEGRTSNRGDRTKTRNNQLKEKIVKNLRKEMNEELAIREKKNKIIMFNRSKSDGEDKEKY